MGRRPGKLSSCTAGTWTLPTCITHPAFPSSFRSDCSQLNSSPSELPGIEKNVFVLEECVVNIAVMFSSTTLKTLLNIYWWTWTLTWTVSVNASAPLRPNQNHPRLTHSIQSFHYYHTATYRLSPTRVRESPCTPSDEAEDFKRSGRSKTAA